MRPFARSKHAFSSRARMVLSLLKTACIFSARDSVKTFWIVFECFNVLNSWESEPHPIKKQCNWFNLREWTPLNVFEAILFYLFIRSFFVRSWRFGTIQGMSTVHNVLKTHRLYLLWASYRPSLLLWDGTFIRSWLLVAYHPIGYWFLVHS